MVRFAIAITLSWVLAALSLCCDGQTIVRYDSIAFCQPTLQLRPGSIPKSSFESQPRILAAKSTEPTANLTEPALVTSVSRPQPHSGLVRRDELYLVRNEPKLDRAFGLFVEDVYRPEVFHLGKIPMSVSVWTAIKRRNPLCLLLNPIVFQASW
jgi:hypothetical protein